MKKLMHKLMHKLIHWDSDSDSYKIEYLPCVELKFNHLPGIDFIAYKKGNNWQLHESKYGFMVFYSTNKTLNTLKEDFTWRCKHYGIDSDKYNSAIERRISELKSAVSKAKFEILTINKIIGG